MLTTDFEGGVPAGNLGSFTKQLRGFPERVSRSLKPKLKR